MKRSDTDKLKLRNEYELYLLNFLNCDLETLIDCEILSFEEWVIESKSTELVKNCWRCQMKIPEYCIIELIEDFNSSVNDRIYRKGERFMAYENVFWYRIVNTDCDGVAKECCKVVYRLKVEATNEIN